ncbi:YcsE-related riboflavin metabolism phosphatase [Mesomycoplasma lagogenitalium]|uniref:HAD family hydrolase n=1 Tax=Mesomycoplasma lagogenitalium TaxID=171286 RepID=A0ABY8LT00_9BACT|nr:HAD family hydrolase [Mesomycoplasma lagogenitalium]WGI36368.1 HAD family hydrolase [Mesomycoplasma lagogenitalium]
MKKYKLVSFDIDGTLLPYADKDFYPEIKNMFKELKKNGYTVVICTGREMVTIGNLLDGIEVDYFLGANGTFIYDCHKKEIIHEDKIFYSDFMVLSDFLDSKNVDYSVMTNKYGFFSEGHSFDSWFLRDHTDKFKWLNELDSNDSLHIITIKTESQSLIEETRKFLKDKKLKLEINSTWSKGFFVGPVNSNKARGLENLGNIINVSLDEMIAFGDSSNDYEMIKEVGYGVAMSDSPENILSVAKDIAKTAEEKGTLLKLKELGII